MRSTKYVKNCVKVVIDTNILVSAMRSIDGPCSRIFELLILERIHNYTSLEILEEMQNVINLLQKRNRLTESSTLLVQSLKENSTILNPQKVKVVKEDPDDDKFFACALAANAQYIISEDKHLLQHNPWKNIIICKAEDFITQIN